MGVIRSPHGVRGEVRIDPRSDVPDRFHVGAVLACDGVGPLTIRSIRGTPADPIVRFDGYASRPEAEPLRGRFLRVAVDEARRATKGSYLWADLVGLRAETPAREPIGRVTEVLRAGETDVLVVTREAARKAAKGAYLWADLLGLVAETPDGTRLGIVREILRAGETDVLVVRDEGTRAEVLLPALASVVRVVDLAAGRVVVVPQDVLP